MKKTIIAIITVFVLASLAVALAVGNAGTAADENTPDPAQTPESITPETAVPVTVAPETEAPGVEAAEPVADINGIEIYEEDVALQMEYARMKDETLSRDAALESAAEEKLIFSEAKKAGFEVTDAAFAKNLNEQTASFNKNLDENRAWANELGMTEDEVIEMLARRTTELMVKWEYCAYIFTSLVDNTITTQNAEINRILEKYRPFDLDRMDTYLEDFKTVAELYIDDLVSASELVKREELSVEILPRD